MTNLTAKCKFCGQRAAIEIRTSGSHKGEYCSYRPDEMRWLDDPVDWVVFDGKQSGSIKEVVFMEGKSTDRTALNAIQREL